VQHFKIERPTLLYLPTVPPFCFAEILTDYSSKDSLCNQSSVFTIVPQLFFTLASKLVDEVFSEAFCGPKPFEIFRLT